MSKGTARGRGLDFEHRLRTSQWAEDLLLRSLKRTDFLACRLGASEYRQSTEISVERETKEPDLLLFKPDELEPAISGRIDGNDIKKHVSEEELSTLIRKAPWAIEVEFSPYRAKEMRQRNWQPRTPEQLKRRLPKRAKPPTAPNIWVKMEDLERLRKWEQIHRVPVLVVHVFDQEAFAVRLRHVLAFDRKFPEDPESPAAIRLQLSNGIFKEFTAYERVDAQGARERKWVYRVTPYAAVKVGDVENVKVKAQLGVSASGKYVTHPVFTGGRLRFSKTFLDLLHSQRDKNTRARRQRMTK